MRTDEKLLLLKNETTYRTDAVPTGLANAVLAKDVEISPLEVTALERGLVKPFLGADEEILTGEHVLISFKVELQGSGTVGTAPALGPVLRSAGFVETVTPATSVEYDLADSDYESASIYFYMGTTLHKLIGALANVKPLVEKGIPYLEFSFIGLWEEPTKVAKPTIDWSTWQKPTPTGEGRTSGFLLNGFAAEPIKLTLDVGQDVKFIETLTTAKVDITNRKSSGNVSIIAPELDEHNYFNDAKNSVTGPLAIQLGQTAGLICTLSCPKVQVKAPKYGDFEGTATLDMDLILIPTDAGNDEIKLTFT